MRQCSSYCMRLIFAPSSLLAQRRRPVLSPSSSSLTSFVTKKVFQSSVASSASSSASPAASVPELKHVPKLPLVGSLWYAHSKIPPMQQSKIFDFWPEMHRRYGDFYTIGIPGLGAGLTGTCYVIQDPVEMARIVRQEGKFPSGGAEFTWPLKLYSEEKRQALAAILGRGPSWKRIRSFLQSDLLHPTSAARYTPAILEAAISCSRGVPDYADNLNLYLNLASFEMFSNVMLGALTGIVDPTVKTEPVDVQFCKSVATALRINSALMQSGVIPALLTLKLGYKVQKYKELEGHWGTAQSISRDKVAQLYEKRTNGTLTETETNCYANQAFERQLQQQQDDDSSNNEKNDRLSLDEVKEVVGGLLAAGVDTTGGFLSWKLLHIALCGKTQDKIHAELTQSIANNSSNGGTHLTAECISPKQSPYLHAALRESHRLANTAPTIPLKHIPNSINVHGVELPPDSVIMLDGYSTGVNPTIAGEHALDFDPTRFLPDAVAARKGTTRAVMDHPFFAGPFSQGARKCPGSRVANLESIALLAQLILDYKITVPGVAHWTDVPYDQETVLTAKLPKMEFTPRHSA